MDLKARARALVSGLGGRMNASPYDIAWLARLPSDHGSGARWPDLLDWLLDHQWMDGSWGGAIPYFHDRILCTLMAIIALSERAPRARAVKAIRRGERYIWRHFHYLHHDPVELVGFELIFPTLLAQARTLGLDVPAPFLRVRPCPRRKVAAAADGGDVRTGNIGGVLARVPGSERRS